MKYLLLGLGNPDKKYQSTRHNAGYLVVDWFLGVKKQRAKESFRRCLQILPAGWANWRGGEIPFYRQEAVFLKTSGVYMNDSGKFVARELKRRCLKPDQLILIHDDLDLPLGEFKLQFGRSDAGHKGVRSVVETLGTKDFWRLRIGIGRPVDGEKPEEYVLGRFTREELDLIEKLVPKIIAAVTQIKS